MLVTGFCQLYPLGLGGICNLENTTESSSAPQVAAAVGLIANLKAKSGGPHSKQVPGTGRPSGT